MENNTFQNKSCLYRQACDSRKDITTKIIIGVGIILFSTALLGLFKLNTTVELLQSKLENNANAISKIEINLDKFILSGERFTRQDGLSLKRYIDVQIGSIKTQLNNLTQNKKILCSQE